MATLVGASVRLEPLAPHHSVVANIANRQVVGTSSFMGISATNRIGEIGSTIYGRAYWRTRVNSEIKYLLLTQAFEVKESNRVCLKTDNLNYRSQAAIERIGGVREGTLRAHRIRTDGTLRDSVYYSILKTEWPQVKLNLQKLLS